MRAWGQQSGEQIKEAVGFLLDEVRTFQGGFRERFEFYHVVYDAAYPVFIQDLLRDPPSDLLRLLRQVSVVVYGNVNLIPYISRAFNLVESGKLTPDLVDLLGYLIGGSDSFIFEREYADQLWSICRACMRAGDDAYALYTDQMITFLINGYAFQDPWSNVLVDWGLSSSSVAWACASFASKHIPDTRPVFRHRVAEILGYASRHANWDIMDLLMTVLDHPNHQQATAVLRAALSLPSTRANDDTYEDVWRWVQRTLPNHWSYDEVLREYITMYKRRPMVGVLQELLDTEAGALALYNLREFKAVVLNAGTPPPPRPRIGAGGAYAPHDPYASRRNICYWELVEGILQYEAFRQEFDQHPWHELANELYSTVSPDIIHLIMRTLEHVCWGRHRQEMQRDGELIWFVYRRVHYRDRFLRSLFGDDWETHVRDMFDVQKGMLAFMGSAEAGTPARSFHNKSGDDAIQRLVFGWLKGPRR